MFLLPEREERIRQVVLSRQHDLTVVLENVHDPHNIGAILRSCDSVGISEIYVIYTDPELIERGIDIGLNSASGALQWVEVHYFTDLKAAFNVIKSKYETVFGTVIKHDCHDLYDLDFTTSAAFFFGNESEGLSRQAEEYIDQNFIIPQHGFVRSLNISVACAVTLYEAQRQRFKKGKYLREQLNSMDTELLEKYIQVHKNKKLVRRTKRINF
jgi:tRNA (guanosine-2'-O-)-methyltransferase